MKIISSSVCFQASSMMLFYLFNIFFFFLRTFSRLGGLEFETVSSNSSNVQMRMLVCMWGSFSRHWLVDGVRFCPLYAINRNANEVLGVGRIYYLEGNRFFILIKMNLKGILCTAAFLLIASTFVSYSFLANFDLTFARNE